jgi:hypothetical protein
VLDNKVEVKSVDIIDDNVENAIVKSSKDCPVCKKSS